MHVFTTPIRHSFFYQLLQIENLQCFLRLLAVLSVACMSFTGPSTAMGAQEQDIDTEKNQWACEVLMCLASAQPMQQEELCKSQLLQLRQHIGKWNQLRNQDRVPVCLEAQQSGTRLDIFQPLYPKCPAGMQTLEVGISVLITSEEQAKIWQNTNPQFFVGRYADELPVNWGVNWYQVERDGVGDGQNESVKAYAERRQMKPLICIAGYLGKALMPVRDQDERGRWSATVDRLEWINLYQHILKIAPPATGFWYKISVRDQIQKWAELP